MGEGSILYWFVNLPISVGLLIVIAACLAFSALLIALVRRFLNTKNLHENITPIGLVTANVGIVCAILMGLVVYAAWREYVTALETTETEVVIVKAIGRDLDSCNIPGAGECKNNLVSYTNSVVENEFQSMRYGKQGADTFRKLDTLWKSIVKLKPTSSADGIIMQEMLDLLKDLGQYRAQRLVSCRTSITAPIWIVLVIGNLIIIVLSVLTYTPKVGIHFALVSSVAVAIAIAVYATVLLDHPFSGSHAVSSDNFKFLLTIL